MSAYVMAVSHAASRPLAAVRARIAPDDIARAFGPALDSVWAFLRRHPGLRTDGHNIFLYHDIVGPAPDGRMTIEFGVEVTRPFEDDGDVVCVHTPGGEVVSTIHHGAYQGIRAAHAAVQHWARAKARELGRFSWEIYGDWSDDPGRLETTIVYLLR